MLHIDGHKKVTIWSPASKTEVCGHQGQRSYLGRWPALEDDRRRKRRHSLRLLRNLRVEPERFSPISYGHKTWTFGGSDARRMTVVASADVL